MCQNLKQSNAHSLAFIILSISLLVFTLSCSDPMTPQLSNDMKDRLDSIFNDQVKELDSLADKNCDEIYLEIFKQAKDSLYNQRVEEIKSILEQ